MGVEISVAVYENFFLRARSVVHIRKHRTDVVHTTLLLIEVLHQVAVVLHHVPFKRRMNVSVEVKPSIEVIFEARDGIVAKHDMVFAIFDFEIVADFGEALQQTSIVASVVVALDENDVAVELFEYVDGGRHITPEHITENIDGITGIDRGVPASNEFGIVFEDGAEGASIKVDTIGVVVMPIRDI